MDSATHNDNNGSSGAYSGISMPSFIETGKTLRTLIFSGGLWLFAINAISAFFIGNSIIKLPSSLLQLLIAGAALSVIVTLLFAAKQLHPAVLGFISFATGGISSFLALFIIPSILHSAAVAIPNVEINQSLIISGVIAILFYFSALGFFSILSKARGIRTAIEKSSLHPHFNDYVKSLDSELQAETIDLELDGMVKLYEFFGIFILIIIFIALVQKPDGKSLYSVLSIMYLFSSIAIHLSLCSLRDIIEWAIKGYETPQEAFDARNRLSMSFLAIPFFLSILLPWNFQIIDSRFLRDLLNLFVRGSNAVVEQGTGNVNLPENRNDITGTPFGSMAYTGKFILYAFSGIIAYLILMGIIGRITMFLVKSEDRPKIVRFFEFHYIIIATIIEGFAAFSMVFITPFLDLFRKEKPFSAHEFDEAGAMSDIAKFFSSDSITDDNKRKEIETIIAHFVRLISTLDKDISPYRTNDGPLEYINRVCETAPDFEEELRSIVEVFNESRYSLHILSETSIADFIRKTDYIISEIESHKKG